MKEARVFISMFERLDLTVTVEMDSEGKIVDCSNNVFDVFGYKRKCVPSAPLFPVG